MQPQVRTKRSLRGAVLPGPHQSCYREEANSTPKTNGFRVTATKLGKTRRARARTRGLPGEPKGGILQRKRLQPAVDLTSVQTRLHRARRLSP